MRKREHGKTKTFKRTATLIFSLVAFIAALFFFTWCRVQSRDIRFEINAERIEQRELSRLQNQLRIEIERLKTPERIGKIAREKLGLYPPKPKQVIVLP